MTVIINRFDEVSRHLVGEEFKENFVVKYDAGTTTRPRNEILVDLARGKRVLHIGCCDHIPLIANKVSNGSWLHGMLTDVASKAVGVDIDKEAVDHARRVSGLSNIYVGDVTADNGLPEISDEVFDIAVLGDVIEHIGNPVQFLSAFRRNHGDKVTEIVITAPNAFRGGNLIGAFKNIETINTDHRFFFTPYTLSKIAVDAGYAPKSLMMASFGRTGRAKQFVINRFPLLAENIILRCTV